MAKIDGGPAFPRPGFAPHDVGYEDCEITEEQDGMSLRDWFAGQAMAGLLANAVFLQTVDHLKATGELKADILDGVATAAYRHAEAMLKRRAQQ